MLAPHQGSESRCPRSPTEETPWRGTPSSNGSPDMDNRSMPTIQCVGQIRIIRSTEYRMMEFRTKSYRSPKLEFAAQCPHIAMCDARSFKLAKKGLNFKKV